MRRNRLRPAAVVAGVLVLALLGVGVGVWLAREARWQGALYCIERPGTLWRNVAPVPEGAQPECPSSRSYRREVRAGESRVEQYRLPGWQPRALLPPLRQAGYRQITDEDIGPGNYAAFLGRAGTPELQYLAAREGDTTVITLSGRP